MKISKARPEYIAMRSSFSFLILALLSSSVSFSQEEPKSDITYVCQKQNDVRWIRTFKVEGNRCRSLYSKEGFVQTVSSAQNFNSCKSVMENIRANIEEGGFKCKDVQLVSMVEID